jgi:metallo-beta-lactamase class B
MKLATLVLLTCLACALYSCTSSSLHYPAGLNRAMRAWNRRAEPFRIVDNVYFVGTNELAIFLIQTPDGNILIDSGFEDTVPLIQGSVEKLGFRFADTKILLSSHAHMDHVGGHAKVRALTGARIFATAPDAAVIRSGGGGPLALDMSWPPAIVDHVLEDGEKVELGGRVLVAHLTAGHTPGATTWTTTVTEAGRRLNVVFFSSSTLFAEMPLENNPEYPQIARDFERSYAFWRAVPCDIFLAPHGHFFQLEDKRDRLAHGETPNPFIDPQGFARLISEQESNFRRRLAEH